MHAMKTAILLSVIFPIAAATAGKMQLFNRGDHEALLSKSITILSTLEYRTDIHRFQCGRDMKYYALPSAYFNTTMYIKVVYSVSIILFIAIVAGYLYYIYIYKK